MGYLELFRFISVMMVQTKCKLNNTELFLKLFHIQVRNWKPIKWEHWPSVGICDWQAEYLSGSASFYRIAPCLIAVAYQGWFILEPNLCLHVKFVMLMSSQYCNTELKVCFVSHCYSLSGEILQLLIQIRNTSEPATIQTEISIYIQQT